MIDRLAIRVAMLKRIEQFLAAHPEAQFESEPDLWHAFIKWYTGEK